MTSASQLQTHARFAAACILALAFAACGDKLSAVSADTADASATDGGGGDSSTAGDAGTNGGSGGTSNQAGNSGTAGMSGEADASDDGGLVDDGGDGGISADAGDGGDGATTPVFNDVGSGADGNLEVDGAVDLSAANSGARTCDDGGDAVSYAVTELGSSTATLVSAPAAGCLAVGDEVLLINLQGTSEHVANVGNYETLKVSAVNGSDVTFSDAKKRFYGDDTDNDTNLGIERTNQRVMLQRVPNYQDVTVTAAGSLTASAWDGVKGGVLFFRATGQVSIAGTLSMSGKGYVGGVQTTVESTSGQQGESIDGLGTELQAGRQGAGGGGVGDGHECEGFGLPGAGAGHATSGSDGPTSCSGMGGSAYGDATLLTQLLLGSGGGAGGTDDFLGDNPPGGFGGRGGGIVVIVTEHLEVTGTLLSAGLNGEGDVMSGCDDGASVTSCWDYSGPGGGGSGGSILLDAAESSLGSILLDAGDSSVGSELVAASGGLGGIGQDSGNGGDGADGRIAVHALVVTGTTSPMATLD